jgi:ribonucleoside-diphosphate reductase beta chain
MTTERVLQTTSGRGLDRSLPVWRLWQRAKKLGTWDPADVDLARDAEQWRALAPLEREVLLHLTALFQGGEEAVTVDLLPLVQVIAAEGRIEEEMFLTSFLWEEAKHVEAFRRFFDEVAGESGDLARFHGRSYRTVFYDELPRSLSRLRDDASPEAQAVAAVTYNMIVEGVLAETGYHGYEAALRRNELLPGVQRLVELIKRDEARHIAYGVYLLSRLVAEHGDGVMRAIESRMGELLAPALGVINEVFSAYPAMPFGLRLDEFAEFAIRQFDSRMGRIEKARVERRAGIDLDDAEGRG